MNKYKIPLYKKTLIIVAFQVVIISTVFAVYNIKLPLNTIGNCIKEKISKIIHFFYKNHRLKREPVNKLNSNQNKKDALFTADQLSLFDGTRSSKPIYLALLGKIYNVEKGRKYYAPGSDYNFLAGKDATRAFITGNFSPEGLTDNIKDFTESELLSIIDWISFYEKDYEFVGFLEGTYYDSNGKPTKQLLEINEKLKNAKLWKTKQLSENNVFPPCNSEWQKEIGGRVWCTTKSGGIKRDWVGVPRKLFSANNKNFRCACVKNFGASLAVPEKGGNRGDLDNPKLQLYDNCSPNSISCKLAKN